MIKALPTLAVLILLPVAASAAWAAGKDAPPADPLSWPAVAKDNMPGTRWWWMGSAVDPADLTSQLQTYRTAGLGTVEITPIYGVKGREKQFIEYLSPQWMEMLKVTVSEAQKLGMNVDMATGTGWCFGGPNVSTNDANASVVVKTFDVATGAHLTDRFDHSATQALVAYASDGKSVDLTDKIAPDGSVNWTPEGGAGPWRVYAVSQKPSGQNVKRPAPGGAGWMLNLIYPDAMTRYLQRFTDAFAHYEGPKPHGQFHDSYEYRSDWSPDFFQQFEKRRGYKLQAQLPALFEGKGEADHVARVRCDYRQTVSELIEESTARWTKWSHDQGFVSRDQAHGSPGNWLDLYAASDVPETEFDFTKDRDVLVAKFASSAAHVTGKRLTSSEIGTWAAEHFTETLADLKYICDDFFLAGVNRVMWHGTAYSPADAAWPGWVFYASTEMNPRNAIWHDVPALNSYLARVQGVLQNSRPDNDVLLYWPICDTWHDAKATPKERLLPFTVHNAREWFSDQAVGKAARLLWNRGYTFDYISDEQLHNAKVEGGAIDLAGNKYRVIVVPACEHMPLETLKQLLALADAGATVIFERHLPHDVPGAANLEQRRAAFQSLRATARSKGHVLTGDIEPALARAGIPREPMVDQPGIQFVRGAVDGGSVYFIANRGTQRLDQATQLSKPAAQAAILDPMTGRIGLAATQRGEGGTTRVHLQLEPGESLILRTFEKQTLPAGAPRWNEWKPAGEPVALEGQWNVRFVEGGPTLPKPFTTEKLGSWTASGGEPAQTFGGTAVYTLHFDAPAAAAQHWSLDLGKVAQSARVRLNGKELGTVFIPPFRVRVDELKPKDNVLEVEVTSTSANRIRDLDRRGVKWKIFYDTNVVNIHYKPFDASNWPVAEEGLIGPVTLRPETPEQ